jgi:hypothetical protein
MDPKSRSSHDTVKVTPLRGEVLSFVFLVTKQPLLQFIDTYSPRLGVDA